MIFASASMGDFVGLVVCGAPFVVVIVSMILGAPSRRRGADNQRRRLDLIEQGLRDPSLDPTTRAELLRSLARDEQLCGGSILRFVASPTPWRYLWFGAAWFLFVLGGSLLASEKLNLTNIRDTHMLVIMLVSGFAMLTMPAALRELARRSGTAPAGR